MRRGWSAGAGYRELCLMFDFGLCPTDRCRDRDSGELRRLWPSFCSHITLHIRAAYNFRELGSCQLSMSGFNEINSNSR